MEMFGRKYGFALVLTLAAMLFSGASAKAQDWSFYGQGSVASLHLSNTSFLYGGSIGLMRMKHQGPITWGPDFRGTLMARGNVNGSYTDQRMDSGTIGLRVGFTPPALPITPYGEAAFGLGYFRAGQGLTRQDKTGAVLEGRAGLDFHVLPLIDWRLAEFTYARQTGNTQTVNPWTASMGIVIHFPTP